MQGRAISSLGEFSSFLHVLVRKGGPAGGHETWPEAETVGTELTRGYSFARAPHTKVR
jgi:hypothetical protein